MKKILLSSLVLALALGAVSCKPKKSAYRQAYEQAKQREIAAQPSPSTPSSRITYEEPTKPASTPVADVTVRKERVSTIEGEDANNLKQYSVVIGAFQNPTNARALKDSMIAKGYKAVLAKNEAGMLRVIIASFNSKEEAAASREVIKAKFAPRFDDAWILYNY